MQVIWHLNKKPKIYEIQNIRC